MGTNTAEAPEVSTEDEATPAVEPTESEEPNEEGAEGEEGEQQEPAEMEVVRSGDNGSQPDTQHGIRKRVNKLNSKVASS